MWEAEHVEHDRVEEVEGLGVALMVIRRRCRVSRTEENTRVTENIADLVLNVKELRPVSTLRSSTDTQEMPESFISDPVLHLEAAVENIARQLLSSGRKRVRTWTP